MFRQKIDWLILAWICLVSGCGDSPEAAQPRVVVSGFVRYRGYPLRQGVIAFCKASTWGTDGNPIVANLHTDGSFTLNEPGQRDIPPGFYLIAVNGTLRNRYSIPSRYRDPETSGLRCNVEPGQPLKLLIELE